MRRHGVLAELHHIAEDANFAARRFDLRERFERRFQRRRRGIVTVVNEERLLDASEQFEAARRRFKLAQTLGDFQQIQTLRETDGDGGENAVELMTSEQAADSKRHHTAAVVNPESEAVGLAFGAHRLIHNLLARSPHRRRFVPTVSQSLTGPPLARRRHNFLVILIKHGHARRANALRQKQFFPRQFFRRLKKFHMNGNLRQTRQHRHLKLEPFEQTSNVARPFHAHFQNQPLRIIGAKDNQTQTLQ